MKTAEEIIKEFIPNGIVNIKVDGKGNGKPQYKAEIDVIKKCMDEYASQFRPSSEAIKAAMDKAFDFLIAPYRPNTCWEDFRDRIAGELGSGVNLPLNLTIWKKAQSMNYSDFAKWFNEELKNNTPPTK